MPFDTHSSISVLRRTPTTLRSWLSGLPSVWVDAAEQKGGWSPVDLVGDLLHRERTDWIPSARIILAQGADKRFEPYDREPVFLESTGKALDAMLDEFVALRTVNIETLIAWRLSEAQLALEGEHPVFGMLTVRQLLATWVAHDLGHIAKVAKVMMAQYGDLPAPNLAYRSVMDR